MAAFFLLYILLFPPDVYMEHVCFFLPSKKTGDTNQLAQQLQGETQHSGSFEESGGFRWANNKWLGSNPRLPGCTGGEGEKVGILEAETLTQIASLGEHHTNFIPEISISVLFLGSESHRIHVRVWYISLP